MMNEKTYGLKLEYLKKETRLRMIMIFLRETLSIVALALLIALTALMIRAVLAVDTAEADIAGLRGEAAMLSETVDAAIDEIVAIRGPVPEEYVAEPAPALSEESAPVPAYDLTAEELDLLERVTSAEVGGAQPYEGIIAVTETILNRSRLWGMTVTEVCEAPGQYTDPRAGEIPDDVKRAVADAVAGIKVFPGKDITHFHNESVTPYWAASKEYVGQIGDHKFYCGKEETK
jgi:spore germination cell wall hydrolase CwlJ-like protein